MQKKLSRWEVLGVASAMFLLGMGAQFAPFPTALAAGMIASLVASKWSE